ncbi:MAG: alpha/beta hydrolase-fold protein [Eubacteriales bacterium]|nr:alpha/beta hydrolase-fold protein [Eubacteriales bacterium]
MRNIVKVLVASVFIVGTLNGCNLSGKERDSLVNHMSQAERDSVQIGEMTLFNQPWDEANKDPFLSETLMEEWYPSDYVQYYEGEKNACIYWDDPEMQMEFDELIALNKNEDSSVKNIGAASTKGHRLNFAGMLPEDFEGDNLTEKKEKLKRDLDEEVKSNHLTQREADNMYQDTVFMWDAYENGECKVVPCGYIANREMQYMLAGSGNKTWDFDSSKLLQIKDSITEIHLSDDEMDMGFVCHVIVPPEYNEKDSYPILFLTDAVWRMDAVNAMWQEMKSGNADKAIIVTLGFDYALDNSCQPLREYYFIQHANLLDDFITDNLMPLLSEQYPIDCDSSTFMGHSNGGFFAYYCLFQSDRYENQPFGNYLIGSPTLWSLQEGFGYGAVINDFGYWERNDSLSKKVVIAVGELEDAEYADCFGDKPSTTEGAKLLNERICAHGGQSSYIVYDGETHSSYVAKMLVEYSKKRSLPLN